MDEVISKRENLLKAIYQHGIQNVSTRSPLLNVCVTRWVENIDGWDYFFPIAILF